MGNDPVNLVDPTGLYECKGSDCERIANFRDQLVEAKEKLSASDLKEDQRVGAAIVGLLEILGIENDGNGLTIQSGDLNGTSERGVTAGKFDSDANTITLDFNAIRDTRQLGGAVLGHELVHKQDFDNDRLQGDTPENYARREFGAHAVEHFIYRGYGTASPYQGKTIGESFNGIRRNVQSRCFAAYRGDTNKQGNCFSAVP